LSAITVLGAGVMGSAMCLPACDRGHDVKLVGTHLDKSIIDSIKATGLHPRLGVTLPRGVKPLQHDEFAAAVTKETQLIILGVSSAGVDWAIGMLCEVLKQPAPIVMITKGMRADGATLVALPDYVASEVRRRAGLGLAVAAIGGPCIAGELAVRRQTGTVITSHDLAFAEQVCATLETDYYHPRASIDVMGVEICAAFKNFFAIGVGWAAGHLEKSAATENNARNHNAGATLFGQAIVEMMVLARALGGNDASVWGMPGAGDLYVTSQAGRNSRLGVRLGQGMTYQEVKSGPMKDDTIEGAELGIAVAATLETMVASGKLAAASLPLTKALLLALTKNQPLSIPWAEFHHRG
jgi:glycerol-3-phosphate dehydrogenase (NAD(P)+)